MDKITISNLQGESGLVNVVRYFMCNSKQILIYSLNEVDEAGYTRLYVAKIEGGNGTYSAESLNDSEWDEIKNIIKLIVKANKEGMPVPVQDLNPKKIDNVILKDKKVFKLNAPLVNDLGNNKPKFEEGETNGFNQPSAQPAFEMPTPQPSVQPAFEMPNVQPSAQPAFEMPNVQPSAQPAFEMPNVQPSAQPAFEIPTPQPSVQPAFEIPTPQPSAQPAFEMPNPQPFEQPAFEMPNPQPFEQPAFEMPSMNTNVQESAMDNYKTMYEEILKKNSELEEKINSLNTKIVQYEEKIKKIKEMIG